MGYGVSLSPLFQLIVGFVPWVVPTLKFGSKRSMFNIGASMENYMSVALELTIPVAVVSVLLGIVSIDMSRVGLKLARGVKSLSLDLPMLLIMLTVPRRQNELLQPVGRLYLFLTSS